MVFVLAAIAAALALVAVYDMTQTKHAVLRNFPVVGHLRYFFERFGPEMRQYMVAGDTEEKPFSRVERSWVYASSKRQRDTVGFGTQTEPSRPGHLVIRPAAIAHMPADLDLEHDHLPARVCLGGPHGRAHAFTPSSAIYITGMSLGALSPEAVTAMNIGAREAGCLHNTGEGGLAPCHRHGGELIFQIGTAYFGCRDESGRFSLEALQASIAGAPVRGLEIKLSQGAKPGLGGHVPAAKVTEEIAAVRGIPAGRDSVSPSRHTAFDDAQGLIDFVEQLAAATGLPVGIKAAVGQLEFWEELAELMADQNAGPDWIQVDGSEGGTGASPLHFADHVGLPFRHAFKAVRDIFVAAGAVDQLAWIGSGKLGLPQNSVAAFALGADMVAVGREAMMSVGCIQALKCHTDRCPVGVATQNPWLRRGLDPARKSARAESYLRALRAEINKMVWACGVTHPCELTFSMVEVVDHNGRLRPIGDLYARR